MADVFHCPSCNQHMNIKSQARHLKSRTHGQRVAELAFEAGGNRSDNILYYGKIEFFTQQADKQKKHHAKTFGYTSDSWGGLSQKKIKDLIADKFFQRDEEKYEGEKTTNIRIDFKTAKNHGNRLLQQPMHEDEPRAINGIQSIASDVIGNCSIAYLVHELQGKRGYHDVFREVNLRTWFGNYERDGVTSDQIINFCSNYGHVKLFIYCFIQRDAIYQNSWNVDSRNYTTLMYYSHNKHLYPILDPSQKKHIEARGNDLCNFNLSYANINHKYVSSIYEYDHANVSNRQDRLIVFDAEDNAIEAMHHVESKYNITITSIKFARNEVVAFYDHVNDVIYEACTDYKKRKKMCDLLYQYFYDERLRWNNQSYYVLCKICMDLCGFNFDANASHMTADDFDRFTGNNRISPYISKTRHFAEYERYNDDLYTIDKNKCYTNAMMQMKENYCIFHAFRNTRNMDKKLRQKCFGRNDDGGYEVKVNGRYYINRPYELGDMVFDSGWAYKHKLEVLLNEGCVDVSDVTCMIPAHMVASNESLKNLCSVLIEILGESSKLILNMVTGILGMKHRTSNKGIFTEDEKAMFYLLNTLQDKNPQLKKVMNRYFVYTEERQPLLDNHISFYEQIVEEAHIELFRMKQLFCSKESRIICMNTDSVTIYLPDLHTHAHLLAPDDMTKYKVECYGSDCQFKKRGFVRTMDNAKDHRFMYKKPSYTIIQEDADMLENLVRCQGNVLVYGIAGAGKTELAKAITEKCKDSKVLNLCFQNTATNTIRERTENPHSHTFDSFFHVNDRQEIDADVVIVDEIFGVPSKWVMKLLSKQKAKLIVMGENHQVLPVDRVRYDYLDCDAFIQCFNHRVNLSYKEGSSRFDRPLFEVAQEFRVTSRLPKTLESNVYQGAKTDIKQNICKTNCTRKQINSLHHPCGTFEIGDDIICKANDKSLKIYNGEIYKIKDISDQYTLEKDGRKVVVNRDVVLKEFDFSNCLTSYKYQGGTIREPYLIHDIVGASLYHQLSKREMYTALTRGTRLDHVLLSEFTDRTFYEQDEDNNRFNIPSEDRKTEVHKGGQIYALLYQGTPIYVGSTRRNDLNCRLSEHKREAQKSDATLDLYKYLKEKDLATLRIQLIERFDNISSYDLLKQERKHIHEFSFNHRLYNTAMIDKKTRFNHVPIRELQLDTIKHEKLYISIQDAIISVQSSDKRINTCKGTRKKGVRNVVEEIAREYQNYHIIVKDNRTEKDAFVIDLNDS